jgi:hypothetical protein
MSTWISRILGAAAVLPLAACSGGFDIGSGAFATRNAPERVLVAERSVVVGGPVGYCVDPAATRDGVKAFVLLGSCASISRDPDQSRPEAPGLMTVVVSSDPATFVDVPRQAAELGGYFRTEAGRAALSRTGKAATVEVLDTRIRNGVLFLHARDTAGGLARGVSNDYWRAFMSVNGRLVTISAIPFSTSAPRSETVFETVEATARRIRTETARLAG